MSQTGLCKPIVKKVRVDKPLSLWRFFRGDTKPEFAQVSIIPRQKSLVRAKKKTKYEQAMEDYENGVNVYDDEDFKKLMQKRWVMT